MSQQRYQVKGKIGQGGLGEVYLAQDTQLDREVALKRMKVPDDGNMEAISADLIREAKTLSALQHPNIVTVYDVGKDEKGPFVVLELLKGETLDAVIDRGGMTLDDFKQVVMQTLEGLIAAQAVGLVHRDLKPGNIMVVWLASGKFQIKILDFGLAKFGLKARPQTEDQGGGIFGSIFFMAPEQFERFPLDARTDMYSLGCIYYQILTTKHPFDGETGVEVMASHLQHHVVPLKQVRPDLPDWLCHWVMWLISREMDDRPSDARMALDYFMGQHHGLKGVPPPPTAVTNPGPRGPGQQPRPGGVVRPPGSGSVSQPISAQGTMAAARSSTPTLQKLPKKKSNAVLWVTLILLTSGLGTGLWYLFFANHEPEKPAVVDNSSSKQQTPAPPPTKEEKEKVKAPEVTPATPPNPTPPAVTSKPPPKPKPTPKPPQPQPSAGDIAEKLEAKSKEVLAQILSGNDSSIQAIATSLPVVAERTKILSNVVASAASMQDRETIHRIIGSENLLESSSLLRADLISSDASIRMAALRAVPAWGPKSSVATALLDASKMSSPEASLQAYCHLTMRMGSVAETRVTMLRKIQPEAVLQASTKTALLDALATIAHPLAKAFALELQDAKTAQAIDAAIAKTKQLGSAELPLSAEDAYIMGPASGLNYDKTARCLTGWDNGQAFVGWDLEIKAPRKVAVQLSAANGATKDCHFRICLGNYTQSILVPQTGSDTQFSITSPIELTVAKPGIYRLVIVPTKLPAGQNLMNLRGVVIQKL